jgi:hypothetical protein
LGLGEDEVTGDWRQLHNEKLNNLYSSPNIFRVIKSRRMRWAGRVACIGERKGMYRVLAGKPDGKKSLGIILKWIFRKWDVEVWTGSSWLRIWTGGGHL